MTFVGQPSCLKPQVGSRDRLPAGEEDPENDPAVVGHLQALCKYAQSFSSWSTATRKLIAPPRLLVEGINNACAPRLWLARDDLTTVAFRLDFGCFAGAGGLSSAAATTRMAAWFAW